MMMEEKTSETGVSGVSLCCTGACILLKLLTKYKIFLQVIAKKTKENDRKNEIKRENKI